MKKKIIALVIATFLGLFATTISFEQIVPFHILNVSFCIDHNPSLCICGLDRNTDSRQA